MHYGVDPHHPDLSSAIETTLIDYFNKHHDLFVYALVDGTFDDTLGTELWAHSQQSDSGIVSLYEKAPLSQLEECAPFLMPLTRELLPRLLMHGNGKPMLSILQSPLSIGSLQRHFAGFLQIRTASDGLCFPLRFADTVCSQDTLAMFNDAQRTAFCSGFMAWHLINRQGTLTTVAGTCLDAASYTPPALGEANALDITDKQYAWLIDSGEEDYILSDLAERAPELIAQRKSSVLYSMISELLTAMDERRIRNGPERQELAAQALMLPDRQQALALLDAARPRGT